MPEHSCRPLMQMRPARFSCVGGVGCSGSGGRARAPSASGAVFQFSTGIGRAADPQTAHKMGTGRGANCQLQL